MLYLNNGLNNDHNGDDDDDDDDDDDGSSGTSIILDLLRCQNEPIIIAFEIPANCVTSWR